MGMTAPNPIPLWKALLEKSHDKNGEPQLIACSTNVGLILMHDEAYRGCFKRNELRGQTELVRALPDLTIIKPPRLGIVDDYIVSYTRSCLQSINKFRVGSEVCIEGLEYAARQDCFNPLKDSIRALKWDGTIRLGTWLARYLGAEQSSYTEEVGRRWLVSAIARSMRPGCKADHILVLEGPQGAGKSTAISIIGGEWYLGRLPPLRDYDRAANVLAGAWIVEMAELDAFRGAGATQIKDFLTQSEDVYRPAYARFPVHQPRTCVFVGTTNDAQYLRDATGARRFWPVRVGSIDMDALRQDRDQLIAEAHEAYLGGFQWWPDESRVSDIREAQEERQETDAWEDIIAPWLDRPKAVGDDYGLGDMGDPKDWLTSADIMKGALSLKPAEMGRDNQTRVGVVMSRLGWDRRQARQNGKRIWFYVRIEAVTTSPPA